jgi:hypothetical protein
MARPIGIAAGIGAGDGPPGLPAGASPLRVASRTACQARGVDRRPMWEWLPFLAEDVGRLLDAVRRDDTAALRAEIAACAALLDHLAELYDGRELAALVGEKIAADAGKGPAPVSSTW